MEIVQGLWLAIVQGLTEFLPVSSSAHLILLSQLTGLQEQGLLIDIALHFGSLLAVLCYFYRDLREILLGKDRKLLWYLVLSCIPLGLFGLLFAGWIESHLRSVSVIALASAVFGVLLWWSQRFATDKTLNLRIVLVMGLAQVLALIPGASRSGVTMTAGMGLGLSKQTAARFSFLMAIPAILMSSAYAAMKWYQAPQTFEATTVGSIVLLSFITALLAIHLFMKIVAKMDFIWFMLYRLVLAVLLFCL